MGIWFSCPFINRNKPFSGDLKEKKNGRRACVGLLCTRAKISVELITMRRINRFKNLMHERNEKYAIK